VIWVVSKEICNTQQELECRLKYIKDVTGAQVSAWSYYECAIKRLGIVPAKLGFYKCQSYKGEYGVVITAHINEVSAIINSILDKKRAIVVINSCKLENGISKKILDLVIERNRQSEFFFAKQTKDENGHLVNCVDNLGEFGFNTTLSERKLFRQRKNGLVKAIRASFDKEGAK
jgi:hypothetical protein